MRSSNTATALVIASLFFFNTVNASAAQGSQQFPAKPIRIVAPFPPAGTADFLSRMLADKLSQTWSQQVVVDNRSGAGGIIGTDIVAKATPDGYTDRKSVV